MTLSVAVFEAATWVKSLYDKIMIENQEKRENMEIKEFVYKLPSNRWFSQNVQLAKSS